MTLTQTLIAWAEKDPAAALLTLTTIGAALVGSLGDLIARSVDGERWPRTFQIAKALQNMGIAIPTMGQRIALAIKGTPPSQTPPPPGAP